MTLFYQRIWTRSLPEFPFNSDQPVSLWNTKELENRIQKGESKPVLLWWDRQKRLLLSPEVLASMQMKKTFEVYADWAVKCGKVANRDDCSPFCLWVEKMQAEIWAFNILHLVYTGPEVESLHLCCILALYLCPFWVWYWNPDNLILL